MPFIPFDEMGVTPEKTKTFGDVSKFIPDKVQVDMNTKAEKKAPLQERVMEVLNKGADKREATTQRTKSGEQTQFEDFTQKLGGALGAAAEVGFETVRSIPLVGSVVGAASEVLGKGLSVLGNTEKGKEVTNWYQGLDDRTKANINALFEIGGALAAPGAAKGAGTVVKSGSALTMKAARESMSVGGRAMKIIENKTIGSFKGKTTQEIMATPESKLHKLSAEDRVTYERELKTPILKQDAKIVDTIDEIYKAEATKLDSKTQNLINKSENASTAEVRGLQEDLKTLIKDKGTQYRQINAEEMAPARDMYLEHSKLKADIRAKAQLKAGEFYPEEITKGEDMIRRLNLVDGKTSKVGEIYDQTKGLKQEISSGGKKGTKVFTADDMETTRAINVLSDYLEEVSGVNFSKSSSMWREWAPKRDKMINKIQPFSQPGFEGGGFDTFTKQVGDYVKGVSSGEKFDFIKATEDLLGKKIGNLETREAFNALSQNQKDMFAAKLAKETALSDAKILKELQLGKIDARMAEIDRKAQTRKNVISALRWIGIPAGTIAAGSLVN